MEYTADNLINNEMARDSLFMAIPMPFRNELKAELNYRLKTNWTSKKSRESRINGKAKFKVWAQSLIDSLETFKPLQQKQAFDLDALNRKAWVLSNSLNGFHNQLKEFFSNEALETEQGQQTAIAAMGEVYSYLVSLTLKDSIIKIDELNREKLLTENEYQSEILSTVLKALEPEWWVRRYKKEYKRMAEEFAVNVGLVGKKSRYCTDHTLHAVKQNDRRNQLFLESIEIEREDGFKVSLDEVIKHSLSNPFNRHAQLMARIAGLEKLGKHENLNASFYTITAPSRFHKNSHKYDGSTPNDARQYLQKTWEQMRAKLARNKIYYFGVRVAEAHKDACPHWHMMLWAKPGEQSFIDDIFIDYAQRVDQAELLNVNGDLISLIDSSEKLKGVVYRTPRLEIKRMLPHLGHPTGYIIKYISKNIKAHDDSKAPDEVLTYADRVNAWARTHRIRQFQFIGDAKVGIWNEARRVSPEIIKKFNITLTDKEQRFIDICRDNDWFNYVRFMRRFDVSINKKSYRDEESQFFTKKTEILGVQVQERNVMRRLHQENIERYERGIKAVGLSEFEFSKMMVVFFEKEESQAFKTRFYKWTKSVKPPDRVEKRKPVGVSISLESLQ